MRLSELGELGLLAELERRGLIAGVEHDAARSAGGPRRDAGRARRGRPLQARLDRRGASSASVPRPSTSATSPRRARSRRRSSSGSRCPATTEAEDVVELYEGMAEPGVPVVGGDTTAAPRSSLSVTAIGRAERVPGRGGARPGDVLVVTGPARRARARPSARGGYVRPPLRLAEGTRLARDGARDARHLRRARRRRRPPRPPLGRPLRGRARPRAARGRRDDRRPRLRRGLRAARRGGGPGAASPSSGGSRRARASSCSCDGEPYDAARLGALHGARRRHSARSSASISFRSSVFSWCCSLLRERARDQRLLDRLGVRRLDPGLSPASVSSTRTPRRSVGIGQAAEEPVPLHPVEAVRHRATRELELRRELAGVDTRSGLRRSAQSTRHSP